MKKLLLTGICASLCTLSWSQQNTTSTGGEATGTGGTVSYSVGQIDYSNSTGSNGNINQGVQQPFEFFFLGGEGLLVIDVNLYPNPTNDFIILQIQDISKNLNYQLRDMNGKLVADGDIVDLETKIDMRSIAKGQYQLNIMDLSKESYSIKIIKN